jgi:hypothetical protein
VERSNVTATLEAASSLPPASDDAPPVARRATLSWAVLGFLALFVGITWPLVLAPSRLLVCHQGDGYFDMLLFWYAFHGKLLQPSVHGLFYPVGVPLGPEQAYWLVPYLSVPLQLFLPLPAIFNLLSAIFFVATAASLFVLSRDLGLSPLAAFLVGAIFVISPAYLNELSHGIPENLCMQWLILFVLLGRRAATRPTRWNVYGSGMFLALAWLSSWYVGAFALLFLPLLPLRRIWPGLLLAAALLAWPMHHALARPGAGAPTVSSTEEGFGHRFNYAVARGLMTGDVAETHAFVGRLGRPDRSEYLRLSTTQILSNSADFGGLLARYRPGRLRDTLPGLLLLGMAILGVATAPRPTLPWLGVGLLCLYLSLGPVVLWRGNLIGPTPSAWFFEHVPIVARMRPIRFILPATMTLALLAGFAFPRVRSRAVGATMLVLLVALSWLEVDLVHVAQYRISLTDATIPPAYRALAADHPGAALIDVPLMPYDLGQGQRLYYQTAHQHPLLDYNFVTINSMEQLSSLAQQNSVVNALLGESGVLRRDDARALAAMGFRYAILHTRMTQSDPLFDRPFLFDPTLFDDLVRTYGEPRVLASDEMLLFDLQSVRSDVWDERGLLLPDGRSQALVPPFKAIPALAEPRSVTVMMAIAASRPFEELRGWLRGAGARVTVSQGNTVLGESRVGTDDWQWIRVPLRPSRNDGTFVNVTVDEPALSDRFAGAVVSALTLYRSGSASAARGETAARPERAR